MWAKNCKESRRYGIISSERQRLEIIIRAVGGRWRSCRVAAWLPRPTPPPPRSHSVSSKRLPTAPRPLATLRAARPEISLAGHPAPSLLASFEPCTNVSPRASRVSVEWSGSGSTDGGHGYGHGDAGPVKGKGADPTRADRPGLLFAAFPVTLTKSRGSNQVLVSHIRAHVFCPLLSPPAFCHYPSFYIFTHFCRSSLTLHFRPFRKRCQQRGS